MADDTSTAPATTAGTNQKRLSYPRFIWGLAKIATDGNWLYYAWMTFLTSIWLTGAHAWAVQVRDGMVATGMTDHVSWGLYIANFTFLVGMAAAAAMLGA